MSLIKRAARSSLFLVAGLSLYGQDQPGRFAFQARLLGQYLPSGSVQIPVPISYAGQGDLTARATGLAEAGNFALLGGAVMAGWRFSGGRSEIFAGPNFVRPFFGAAKHEQWQVFGQAVPYRLEPERKWRAGLSVSAARSLNVRWSLSADYNWLRFATLVSGSGWPEGQRGKHSGHQITAGPRLRAGRAMFTFGGGALYLGTSHQPSGVRAGRWGPAAMVGLSFLLH